MRGAGRPTPPFTATAPGAYRLQVPLLIGAVMQLRPEGLRLIDSSPGALTMDLSGVSSVDSAGLALLVDWLAAARAAGRTLHYRQLPEALLSLARLSEVEGLLTA